MYMLGSIYTEWLIDIFYLMKKTLYLYCGEHKMPTFITEKLEKYRQEEKKEEITYNLLITQRSNLFASLFILSIL